MKISLVPGHLFDELAADEMTAALINFLVTNGYATVDDLPVIVGEGGTGAQNVADAQKNLLVGGRLEAWVTAANQNPTLGTLPADAYEVARHMHVTEAFDSDGTDEISLGDDADNDAYATATDVSTTGVKAPAAGADEGYNSSSTTIKAYYVNGGSEPTVGKCLCIVEYLQVTTEP